MFRVLTTKILSAPINYFGGSPLNRLSWLRSSQIFLNAILVSPATRWLLFKDGQSLFSSEPDSEKSKSLARLTTSDVRSLLGPEPFFAQGQNEGDIAENDVSVLEAARLRGPPLVFLGLDEPSSGNETQEALPSSDFSAKTDPASVASKINGTPYFSLDVSQVEQKLLDEVLQSSEIGKKGAKFEFIDARPAMRYLDWQAAAIVAEGKSMVDWNARNKFCPACGSLVYSLWAGWKLSCSSLLPWADKPEGKKPCPTAVGLNNFAHPRTDAVVIMAVVNEANDKILLGRNRKWPGKFYSALAGFIEPGETLEDSVKRELWEEAGLKVWGVKYHSTQPWPFPANLMVGFYAIADPAKPTRVDLDNELEEANWFTREQILAVLNHPDGSNFAIRDPKPKSDSAEPSAIEEPAFKVPPLTAIAGVLIDDWAKEKVIVGSEAQLLKGNL